MNKKILEQYNGFQNGLKNNTRITYFSIIFCIVTVISSSLLCYKFWNDSIHNFLIVDAKGQNFNLILANRKANKNLTIEGAMRHFYNCLYTFSQYNTETQKEKALWLGDSSIEKIVAEFNPFYNDIVENNANVESYITEIEISGEKEPYNVLTRGEMLVRSENKIRVYQLDGTCKVISVSADAKLNPFGWQILDWEDNRKLIENNITIQEYEKKLEEKALENGEN